jgi:hypothetical protein
VGTPTTARNVSALPVPLAVSQRSAARVGAAARAADPLPASFKNPCRLSVFIGLI